MAGLKAFQPVHETPALAQLRLSVRKRIDELAQQGAFEPTVDPWITGWDRSFSELIAREGWVGMTIPTEYGGHGRTFLDRYVVTEELLAAGAPVAAHWFADRQIAPALLKHGTAEQKADILPRIARGELMFAIGMSEPDTGSDLASVRTRATPQSGGGWQISGTKIWTSGAHHADKILMLARSGAVSEDRHAGLSQFIVDLDSPGITVRPIPAADGRHHFNEVFFDAVSVGDDAVLGTVGNGWAQVMGELAFERSGPERFLTALPILQSSVDAIRSGQPSRDDVSRHFARMATLRRMSYSVANDIERAVPVDVAAGIVKILGTTLEGDVVQAALVHADTDSTPMPDALRRALTSRASFTLRGGTNEVLQGVIAKSVGARG